MFRLWPRGQIDIDWASVIVAWGQVFARRSAPDAVWPGERPHLAMLSVRSAWDAYLGVMNWEPGGEILVSEANIEDMVSIIRAHRLTPVPVPVSPETLSIEPSEVERRITSRTKAILVAHLFGSLLPLDGIGELARERNLPLIEDAAQTFRGVGYRGHPTTTLTLFSFGIIKTQTALGGAVVFGDESLLHQLAAYTRRWPRQSRSTWLKRLAQVSVLKLLSDPLWFGLLWRVLESRGLNPDDWLGKQTRGFVGDDWLRRIRHRPGHALLNFLRYRLHQTCEGALKRRTQLGESARRQLPASCLLGQNAPAHCHWVFPIQTDDSTRLTDLLRRHGFDATHSGSRVASLLPGSPLHTALERALFLPVYARMRKRHLDRLCALVSRFRH